MIFMLCAFISAAFLNNTVNAGVNGGKETITIQTSAQCGACEKRITEAVTKVDGVKKVSFDDATKKLTVTFIGAKTNATALKQAISAIGYDADDIAANHDAYHNLPSCCQKDGHKH